MLTNKSVLGIVALLFGVTAGAIAAQEEETQQAQRVRVAHIAIRTLLPEAPQPTGLFAAEPRNFGWYLERVRKAAADPDIAAILVELRATGLPLTRAQEIRRAVFEAQVQGKPVVGVLPSVATTADYVALAGCDRLIMVDGGWLVLTGVRAESWYFRDLLDWLGIKASFVQAGEFKGAAEPFTRRGMSPQLRAQLTRVVDDLFDQVCLAVAGKLGCSQGEAAAIVEGGPYTARRAVARGLIDSVVAARQVDEATTGLFQVSEVELVKDYGVPRRRIAGGFAGMMQLMQLLMAPPTRTGPSGSGPVIAVIYCTGLIVEGKSSLGLLGGVTMGDETITAAIRKARSDPRVAAIVLRVDSPGGSAVASERIWQEVRATSKPVVVSMGQVAASGGYYISAGADKILAEPATLTGSIGVVGGKLALRGLLEKIGIRPEAVQRGKNADLLSLVEPADEEAVRALEELVQETYDLFLRRVRESRGMTEEQLRGVAEGRIWTGRQAAELGLVDRVGTLDDAIQEARRLAGIVEGQPHQLMILPEPKTVFDLLLELDEAGAPPLGQLKLLPLNERVRRQLAVRMAGFRMLLESENPGVWALMPMELVVY